MDSLIQNPAEEVAEERGIARREAEKVAKRVFVSTVSASYTGGDPYVGRDGGTVVAEPIPVLAHDAIRPSDTLVEIEVGKGETYGIGVHRTRPAGLLYVGRYEIVPRLPLQTSANVGVNAGDQCRILRFELHKHLLVASVHFQVTTAETGKFAGVAVYSSEATNQTRLLTTGAVSVATTGIKSTTLGSPVQLIPGTYFIAWTSDSTTARLAGATISSTGVLQAGTLQLGRGTNSGAAGVPPTDLDALVDISLAEYPLIKLQA